MENNEINLENWDDFAGDYIKAEHIKEFPGKLVCIGIEGYQQDGKAKLKAEVEYNGKKWKFDLNKTNQNFIKFENLMPKDIIGKVITVDKTKVMNPTIKRMVDSLIIVEIDYDYNFEVNNS